MQYFDNIHTFEKEFKRIDLTTFPNKVEEKDCIVTVIIFAYNHEDYIEKCIRSILNQKTNFKYYIQIAEDDSTDNTYEICKKIAKQNPKKIKLVQNKLANKTWNKKRPTGKFNIIHSLLSCQTKYIAICDGDDYWINDLKLQKQIEILEQKAYVGIVCSNFKLLNHETGEIGKRTLFKIPFLKTKEVFSVAQYFQNRLSQTSTYVFRNDFKIPRSILDAFGADDILLFEAAKNRKIYFINEEMSVYRVKRPESVGNDSTKYESEFLKSKIKSFKNFNQQVNGIHKFPFLKQIILSKLLLKQLKQKSSLVYFFTQLLIKLINFIDKPFQILVLYQLKLKT